MEAEAVSGTLPAPVTSRLPQLTEDTVKNLLEVQAKELQLRSKEIDLRLRELDNNSAHAEKMLAAQERDREKERNHNRNLRRDQLLFVGVLVVGLLMFSAYGISVGKEALVKDVLQIVLGGVAGALGGYGYARRAAAGAEPPG